MTIASLFAKRASVLSGGDPQTPGFWLQKLFGVAKGTAAGINVTPDIAMKYSAIWAAVNIISGAVGYLPLATYKRIDGDGREKAREHPVYRLLHDRANEFMDASVFRETLQAHALTWGNGYAEIQRDAKFRPIALWPLLPNRTVPRVVKVVSGERMLVYETTVPNGAKVVLPYYNVLHIKGLGFDGLKGYPVIQYAAESIGLGMGTEKYAGKFFANGAHPSGVLLHDKVLEKQARDQLASDWNEMHKGLDESHRIAILDGGLTWKEIGVNAKESQMIETRKFQITDVARWYQIPVHMLSEMSKSSFNNIEHQGIKFVQMTLWRWLNKWSQESNFKLFTTVEQKTYFTEFMTDALLRGDTKTRFDVYSKAIQWGIFSPNEVRAMENKNPYDGGEEFLQPLNMAPAGDTGGDDEANKFRALYKNAWQRIITKEVNAVRKAAKQPNTFDVWSAEFYSNHAEYIERLLGPVLQADCRGGQFAGLLAEKYIKNHIDEIRGGLNGGDIESVLDGWQASPAILTAEITGAKNENKTE